VTCDHRTVEEHWKLSREGSDRLLVGQPLKKPSRVLQMRVAADPKDMSLFELMVALEQDGWECRTINKQDREAARTSPYRLEQCARLAVHYSHTDLDIPGAV
jgi:hypothetical protein